MVSLPDFDPNQRASLDVETLRNRSVSSVYEMGGIFQIFGTALALETRQVTPGTLIDVTRPLRVGRTVLRDDQPSTRPLSVADVFARSSVIGAARIAQRGSPHEAMSFLSQLGLLDPIAIEVGESAARPVFSGYVWGPLGRTTMGYGYGIAVSPLQAAVAATAIVNHGLLLQPTLLARAPDARVAAMRVVSEETSASLRAMLRQVVVSGTGAAANR